MLSRSFAVLNVLVLFVKCTTALTSVELHFASNNCDEEPRSLSSDKVYNLTWNGQITPKLCSFTFNRWGITHICFQSTLYDLQYSMGDVEIKITNYTKSDWDYNRYEDKIPRTCVQKAYKLDISILVPKGYQSPISKTYIELRITGINIEEDSSGSIVLTVIVVGIFIVVVGCVGVGIKTGGKPCQRILKGLLKIIRCCFESVLCCLGCEGKNQSETSAPPHVETEITNIADESDDSVISRFADPAPSYQSIEGTDTKTNPSAPPPSYEEVVGHNVPSAPPE